MAQIRWGKRAVKDLKTIYDCIAGDSVFYANRFDDKFISRVDQLELNPKTGRIAPEKEDPAIRELIEGNYRIFYKLKSSEIFILRIHHAARKIK